MFCAILPLFVSAQTYKIKKAQTLVIRCLGSPQATLLYEKVCTKSANSQQECFFCSFCSEVVIQTALSKYFQMSCTRLPEYIANIVLANEIMQILLQLFYNERQPYNVKKFPGSANCSMGVKKEPFGSFFLLPFDFNC